jgi:N6-L-threonylcarbamoyladenine synthase
MKSPKYVLGIETSCDDTSVAILHNNSEHGKVDVLSHLYFSQEILLRKWGGVVPEIAARNHLLKLAPLIESAFEHAKLKSSDINLIAVTALPGLLGPLLTGINAAKTLSLLHEIPILPVNHLFAHLEAIHLTENVTYPYLGLLVSGGHSIYFLVKSAIEFEILGSTIDDAAGEAFDKTAKLMGLDYPGGPLLAQLATQGDAKRYKFPRPMTDRPGLDFSFSGLKTAAAQAIAAQPLTPQVQADIAASFQQAVVDTIVIKCIRALDETGYNRLVMAGGVSANESLRQQLASLMQKRKGDVFYPGKAFCTDNGAMIAFAGYQRLKAGQTQDLSIGVTPRWPLTQLTPLD